MYTNIVYFYLHIYTYVTYRVPHLASRTLTEKLLFVMHKHYRWWFHKAGWYKFITWVSLLV